MSRVQGSECALDCSFDETVISVIDTETTGLYPGADRLVEISIVKITPGEDSEVVIDTLINPERPVAASEIHGITDDDVADAPTFEDIAGDIANAVAGTVVAAYNVYFDMRFIEDEFGRVGFRYVAPHVCLMYLRPLLGLGRKCSLSAACRAHGIHHTECHTAVGDASASAKLWSVYRQTMSALGLRTFRDLKKLKNYKFMNSLAEPLTHAEMIATLRRCGRAKRRVRSTMDVTRADQLHEYMDALTAAVADLDLSDEEIAELEVKRLELQLKTEELRAVHGRVFARMLGDAFTDSWISDEEWNALRRLHACLAQLGWAPGL